MAADRNLYRAVLTRVKLLFPVRLCHWPTVTLPSNWEAHGGSSQRVSCPGGMLVSAAKGCFLFVVSQRLSLCKYLPSAIPTTILICIYNDEKVSEPNYSWSKKGTGDGETWFWSLKACSKLSGMTNKEEALCSPGCRRWLCELMNCWGEWWARACCTWESEPHWPVEAVPPSLPSKVHDFDQMTWPPCDFLSL